VMAIQQMMSVGNWTKEVAGVGAAFAAVGNCGGAAAGNYANERSHRVYWVMKHMCYMARDHDLLSLMQNRKLHLEVSVLFLLTWRMPEVCSHKHLNNEIYPQMPLLYDVLTPSNRL